MNDKWVRRDIVFFDLMMLFFLVVIAVALLYAPSIGSFNLFVPMGGVFLTMILTYNLGMQQGLILSILLTFIYGSYVIYQALVVHKILEVNFAYICWFFFFPISSFLVGRLAEIVMHYKRDADNEAELKKLVTIDVTTGFYNAQGFFRKLDEEFLRAQRYKTKFSVLLIRISNFDSLRKIYGEINLVRILQSTADIVSKETRYPDVKSVVEGDMLGVILAETDEDGAKVVVEKLHRFMDSVTTEINGIKRVIRISPSMGIASVREGDKDALEIYERAKGEFIYDKG